MLLYSIMMKFLTIFISLLCCMHLTGIYGNPILPLNSQLETVNLSYNNIEIIENYQFFDYPSVLYLYITHNRIKEIDEDSFVVLRSLAYLDLSHNKLGHIHDNTFIDNLDLESLYLNFNPLDFSANAPILKSPSLRYLHLSHCNISSLQPKAFSGIPQLDTLDLSHNPLDSFIGSTRNSTVLFSNSLSTLYLSHCNILSIHPDTLSGIPNLVTLDLRHNNLETISPYVFKILPFMVELILENNPWKCCSNETIATMRFEAVDASQPDLWCFTPAMDKLYWSQIDGSLECGHSNEEIDNPNHVAPKDLEEVHSSESTQHQPAHPDGNIELNTHQSLNNIQLTNDYKTSLNDIISIEIIETIKIIDDENMESDLQSNARMNQDETSTDYEDSNIITGDGKNKENDNVTQSKLFRGMVYLNLGIIVIIVVMGMGALILFILLHFNLIKFDNYSIVDDKDNVSSSFGSRSSTCSTGEANWPVNHNLRNPHLESHSLRQSGGAIANEDCTVAGV